MATDAPRSCIDSLRKFDCIKFDAPTSAATNVNANAAAAGVVDIFSVAAVSSDLRYLRLHAVHARLPVLSRRRARHFQCPDWFRFSANAADAAGQYVSRDSAFAIGTRCDAIIFNAAAPDKASTQLYIKSQFTSLAAA